MKLVRTLLGVLQRAITNLIAQRRLHLLAIGVMALSLSVLGAFVVVAGNLAQVRADLGGERKVTAFVAAGMDEAARQQLRAQARALPGVESAQLLDHEAASARFREALGAHAAILDDLGEAVVPSIIVVTALPGITADGIDQLARDMQALVGVEEVAYAYEELKRLSALIRIIEIAALGIGALIALVTVLIASNTIRLTVMARAEEIAIMKLVGATDGYVRAPFVIEGLIGGLVAGGVAVLIVAALDALLERALGPVAAGAFGQLDLATLSGRQALMLVGLGALLGLGGGLVSVGRFLRADRT